MTTPTVADYLKYASLQMAAEAFLFDESTNSIKIGQDLIDALKAGNGYASRFTPTQATEFIDPNTGWTVVAQKPNTATGFSGTLFRNNATGELVLSFRSTEFVRDAIRDSAATNTLEINATGWAWGQIADMEAWFDELNASPDLLQGKSFSVTGYSLGGHLATAFNLLHNDETINGEQRIKEVVTFNGAGVGEVKTGTLTDALNYFTNLLANPAAVKAGLMLATPELAQFYDVLHQNLLDGTWTATQAKGELSALNTAASAYDEAMRAALEAEKAPLYQALNEIIALQQERARIAGFTSGGSDADAGTSLGTMLAPAADTVAETLDYRLAVILAGRKTNAANLVIGALLAIGDKADGAPQLSNQWDLVGIETSSLAWSAVAHSLWHHGTDVPVFIEDQPFLRGGMSIGDLLSQEFLKDKFSLNNFSDTHSLVLIVDSLSVQNTLLQLVAENQKSTAAEALGAIFKAASWHTKEQISNEQGHAEGDVLENVVNALSDLFLGPKPKGDVQYLIGSLDGNTWAEVNDGTGYTGREKFYQRLKEITNKIAAADLNAGDPNLLGKFTLQASTGNLAAAARTDFLAYAALYSLSPFVLKAAEGTTAEQIETALADAWGATFLDWSADKAVVAAGQTATDVTDEWLKDRADFLERKQWFNANNQNPVNPGATYNPDGPRDFSNELQSSHYIDQTSGYEIQQGITFPSTRVYAFGSSGDDPNLVGNALEDHLYGGAGNDTLQGMGGNDWLEGNADDDVLDGGDGNDTLIGGLGNDTLIGGTGTDRYVIYGNDIIRDADGLGAIVDRSGRLIAGVIEEQADGSYVFLLDPTIGISKDTNLTLSLTDGSQVVIENFQTGQLGLNIARHATGGATALTITGDLAPADTDPTKEGIQIGYDALGNLIVSGDVQEGRSDVLYDSAGADLILGLAGNDIIHAVNGGDNRVEGGAGMDRIDGGADADLVIGGEGVDTIDGGAGNDRLYADELIDLDNAIAQGRTGPGSAGAGETLDGGLGADIVIGGTGNDVLFGGGGVDVLVGGEGLDTIEAGDDADLVFGGAGRDMITAGSGADLVQGGEEGDIVNGGAGDDRLYADEVVDELVAIARGDSETGTGNKGDWLAGGSGDDTLVGSTGNDVLMGGGGQDLLIGGAGDDDILGDVDWIAQSFDWTVTDEAGNLRLFQPATGTQFPADGAADVIYAGAGNDHARGGIGNDVIFGEGGNDSLIGHEGNDMVVGGDGDDVLWGEADSDCLDGGAAQDTLYGGTGDDILIGGQNDDELYGGTGDDVLIGGQNDDELYGGTGQDTYIYNVGDGVDTIYDTKAENNILRFGAGVNKDNIKLRLGSLLLDLGNGDAVHIGDFDQSDVFNSASISGFEFADGSALTTSELLARGFDLDGTDGDDVIVGTNTTDRINGYGGNDKLLGQLGDDQLAGGSGNDALDGGAGDDSVEGGSGQDILSGGSGNDSLHGGTEGDLLTGGDGNDYLDGEEGNDELQGGDGADSLFGGTGGDLLIGELADDYLSGDDGNDELQGGAGYDTLDGGSGNDRLYGQADDDVLDGGDGIDELQGGDGNDSLVGGADSDVLYGQDGNDTLDGGAGDDVLSGDGGVDTYIFGRGYGKDVIYNFDGTYSGTAGTGILQFNADVTPEDIQAYRRGNDLILAIADTGDEIAIKDHFVPTRTSSIPWAYGTRLAAIKFADNTTWTSATIPLYYAGSTGNDSLNGTNNTDTFVATSGGDTFSGGNGADIFHWGLRAGIDRIYTSIDNASVDTILIDGTLIRQQIYGRFDGDNVVLMIDNSPDQLTIYGARVHNSYQVKFASDGTTWALTEFFPPTPLGTEGNDSLVGSYFNESINGMGGNDTIDGVDGNDTIYGGAGNDVITVILGIVDGGDGDDSIITSGGGGSITGGDGNDQITNIGTGGIVLDGGAGDDTLTSLSGYGGSDTLVGGTGSDSYFIDVKFGPVFDFVVENPNEGIDTVFTASSYTLGDDVENLTLNSSYYGAHGTGNDLDNILTGSIAQNDTLTGGAGDDTLDGGGFASDTLEGGIGNDIYVFKRGAGPDLIAGETSSTGTLDVIRVAPDVLPTDVVATRDGNDLVVSIVGTWDQLRVSGYFTTTGSIEQIQFLADGSAWDLAAIQAMLPSESSDSLSGTAASDVIRGLGGNDTIYGFSGNDTIDGGTGNDSMLGGIGNDTYDVDSTTDVVVENANEGTDTVQASVTYTLATNVENLQLQGTSDINATGNALNNVLTGSAGSNLLNGGAGADTMQGGVGNDTYTIDNVSDVVVENINEGFDAVQSSVTYTLSANIENLTLTGTAAINGTGNSLNNVLTGNSANNVLAGGSGDDIFIVTSGDTVVENASEGFDTVQSAVTWTLGANVESLMLTGTGRINGTGNALNNYLTGNTANNSLSGGAGDDWLDGYGGTDTLIGGTGNDYYYINDAKDTVTENANAGTDTVQASFAYTLGSNLENLVLAPGVLINGTGNAVANVITGNALDNVLNGAAGADTMVGGGGNDTFVVDNVGDVLIENPGEGTDVVQSSVTYALAANVENLTLTGTTAINGTGNALSNTLTGNSAANVLTGGAGDDVYVVGAGDSIIEYANEGIDTVQSASTVTLSANVENLTLTGTTAINGTGNALNNTLTGNSGANVLTGGLGDDTYVIGSGDTVVENVNEGTDTVLSSVSSTLASNVENLTLTDTSAINATGNSLNNVLTGNSAANVLTGGMGDDTYVMFDTLDTIVENTGQGVDTVQSSVTYTLGANLDNLLLAGSAATSGTGNALNNVLTGNAANNALDGGAGIDTLIGGSGDDTYVVDSAGDVVIENSNEGSDTVQAYISFTAGATIENVTLLGSAAINATGNSGDNVLIGNSAANVLTGGVGNDTYGVGAGDVIVEYANEGIDTAQSSSTYTLGVDLENLILTGASAVDGYGNDLDNVITGNAGNNVLDGGSGIDTLNGGAGNDSLLGRVGDALYGGLGDDNYVIDDVTEVITEYVGEGTDSVQVSFSYTLGANLENLTLTGTATNGTGNGGNNVITGNALDNVLDGVSGVDTMIGGAGNDTYVIDNSDDVIVENAGEGTDTVQSSSSYMLGANVENLTLSGTYVINGTGNSLDNVLIGNNRMNVLAGGAGNDTYYLGTGDTVVENASEGIDTIITNGGHILGANVENMTLTGSSSVYLTGNSLNNVLTGNSGANAMTGGAGDDTYIIGAGDTVVENANEGTDTVQVGFSYTLGANVENLTLTGTSPINGTGNTTNNVLVGTSGNNTLDGGAGVDTMSGGLENDVYIVDNSGDLIIENLGEGSDIVLSSATYALSANIEDLTLTGTAAINGTGNALNNVLTGNSAANILSGGLGDDTYANVDTLDTIVENANEGTDTVQSSVSYTLGANLENLVLTGSGAISGTGNSLNNVLQGNSAANTLLGGLGDDTYLVSDNADTLLEGVNEGIDTVQSSVSYVLAADFENLVLTGSAAISGTGNAANNVLVGNASYNTLDGGAGADTMQGGLGNDLYIVDSIADVVVENSNEGNDTVQASFSYALGANVENLTLSGTASINGIGNSLDNVLTGNSATNILTGGAGNDTYVIDGSDVVVENVDEGTDTIQSSMNYVLGEFLENLTLLGAATNGTGNALDNALVGNSLANLLVGETGDDTLDGGIGIDTLIGGTGDDTYVINTASDVIIEYAAEGTDTVKSSVSYAMGVTLENLILTGAAEINGTGNSLNNFITGNDGINILVGGAGDDTYVIGADDAVIENTDEGFDTVQSSASFVLGSNIENLTLTGGFAINGFGNELANVLVGNAADNTLDGQAGPDTMDGGAGNDIYLVDEAGDVVMDIANGGVDTVFSAVDFVLGDNLENLVLNYGLAVNGTGNGLDNSLVGGMADNILEGLAGNDTLDGGRGADTMVGGAGNDTYLVDDVLDVAVENATEGVDAVLSTVDYTLGDNLENLTLSSFAAVAGTGNAADNVIVGSLANNMLDGGAGADTMSGGQGDDTYAVDNAGDSVNENSSAGFDTVLSSITYALGNNVENLTLTGSAAIDGTGNDADNVLVGNGAANNLSGGLGADWLDGSAGADTMLGGGGLDTYVVDNAADIVQEVTYAYIFDEDAEVIVWGAVHTAGVDQVLSSVSFSLDTDVENLTLTGGAAINGTGNELSNVLIGNSAGNVLNGGLAADVMIGGLGDDTYVVDDQGDWVGEYANEGFDSVQSSITYQLGVNLESLMLMGSAAINGSGNELDNVMVGNSANNALSGADGNDTLDGGSGSDTLIGGRGNDAYLFARGNGADTIAENDAIVGNTDLAQFANGVAADQIWFRHVGNNLEMSIIGTSDKLTVQNWYSGSEFHVEQFKTADNKLLLDTQVENLVQAMAAFAPPTAGQTTLPPSYQTALEPVIAANWQ